MVATYELKKAKRIVIKVGSALLVDAKTGMLRQKWLNGLASDVAKLRENDVEVILISSGSIALGRHILGLTDVKLTLETSQATAAVGQIRLARAYQEALAQYDLIAAQLLLTLDDSRDRRRYLNTRATVFELLERNVIPIVNENDTVATDEIRFGDNDRLAAQVAAMISADLLVLLSDVDGIYTANPKHDATAKHIPIVGEVTPELEAMAGDADGIHSKGGMKTKLMAAKTATLSGSMMMIAQGDVIKPISNIIKGAKVTLFKAAKGATSRKMWIASLKPVGFVSIDQGAIDALKQGKSLLSVGVISADGMFERGDLIDIKGPNGQHIAQGLAGYDCDEVTKILGVKTEDISGILGYPSRLALIHRDNLVMEQ